MAALQLAALERFDFDSVLLPYSYTVMQNEQYQQEFEALLALCQDRNVAVQTIKAMARRRWREDENPTTTTWYKTFDDEGDI